MELQQEEQEWIDQEEAKRKYQDIKADLQSLKICQHQIQHDVSGTHEIMASLKEDMNLIKDVSTQLALASDSTSEKSLKQFKRIKYTCINRPSSLFWLAIN